MAFTSQRPFLCLDQVRVCPRLKTTFLRRAFDQHLVTDGSTRYRRSRSATAITSDGDPSSASANARNTEPRW